MKNPFEVLKTKEKEVAQVKKEINALRVTIQLIGDEKSAVPIPRWTCAALSKCRRLGSSSLNPVKHKKHGRTARAFV